MSVCVDCISFSDELKERLKPDTVLFFLRVEARGLTFPLHNHDLSIKQVFVMPGMILAVIRKSIDIFTVKWNGPVLETDYKHSDQFSVYRDQATFILDIPCSAVGDGLVSQIDDQLVKKMAHHAPAVLF